MRPYRPARTIWNQLHTPGILNFVFLNAHDSMPLSAWLFSSLNFKLSGVLDSTLLSALNSTLLAAVNTSCTELHAPTSSPLQKHKICHRERIARRIHDLRALPFKVHWLDRLASNKRLNQTIIDEVDVEWWIITRWKISLRVLAMRHCTDHQLYLPC
jgi:hypothetical protein